MCSWVTYSNRTNSKTLSLILHLNMVGFAFSNMVYLQSATVSSRLLKLKSPLQKNLDPYAWFQFAEAVTIHFISKLLKASAWYFIFSSKNILWHILIPKGFLINKAWLHHLYSNAYIWIVLCLWRVNWMTANQALEEIFVLVEIHFFTKVYQMAQEKKK